MKLFNAEEKTERSTTIMHNYTYTQLYIYIKAIMKVNIVSNLPRIYSAVEWVEPQSEVKFIIWLTPKLQFSIKCRQLWNRCIWLRVEVNNSKLKPFNAILSYTTKLNWKMKEQKELCEKMAKWIKYRQNTGNAKMGRRKCRRKIL